MGNHESPCCVCFEDTTSYLGHKESHHKVDEIQAALERSARIKDRGYGPPYEALRRKLLDERERYEAYRNRKK